MKISKEEILPQGMARLIVGKISKEKKIVKTIGKINSDAIQALFTEVATLEKQIKQLREEKSRMKNFQREIALYLRFSWHPGMEYPPPPIIPKWLLDETD